MKTLKEFLMNYCQEQYEDTSDELLLEAYEEDFERVEDDIYDEHRWYDVWHYVNKVIIDGNVRFFSGFYYKTRGDGDADDYGLERMTLEDIVELYPHTISTVVYKGEPK